MTTRPTRLLVRVLWLLTPFAAWAASFAGAWIGARATTRLLVLILGGVIGGVVGTVTWVLLVRRVARPLPGGDT